MNLSTNHSHCKFGPLKVLTLELSRQIRDIEGLDGYRGLKVLVRLHGTPIGYVTMPLLGGRCTGEALVKTILDQHSWMIMRHLLRNGLTAPVPPTGLRISNLVTMAAPNYTGSLPFVTVAVCTRDRTADLSICLEAISRLDYPRLDILVVDNAPKTGATEQLVRTKYPNIRYCCEHRPGLNWARNRAIIEALGEIIAFTDDDAVADPRWISALARVFAENSEVMAVTGLVVPYELETDAQILFEMYGGFGRGFERKWYRLDRESGQKETYHIGAGAFGTGANMAFRLSLFGQISAFDPGLDVGTPTNGGGDLDMFFRVLQEGHTLVYEPRAIVSHRHRPTYQDLKNQLTNHGVGFYSFLLRSALAYPREAWAIILFGLWWLWRWNIRRLLISMTRPNRFPRDLMLAELKGSLIAPFRFVRSRRYATKIKKTFDDLNEQAMHRELGSSRALTKKEKVSSQPRGPFSNKGIDS